MNEVVLRFVRWAEGYYRHAETNEQTDEVGNVKLAVRPVCRLFGTNDATRFGPQDLRALQEHLISQGLSRGVTNQRVKIVRRMFRWAASYALVPAEVQVGLSTFLG